MNKFSECSGAENSEQNFEQVKQDFLLNPEVKCFPF